MLTDTPDGRNRLHLHASSVVIGESAVLVRGPSGSGKTWLCLQLIAAGRASGIFTRLVGDDRVDISLHHGRLLVRPIASIAGLVERRGLGLTPVVHEAAACVRLVVDFEQDEVARMPEPEMLVTELFDVMVPRLAFDSRKGDAAQVLAALCLFNDEPWAS